MTKNLLVASSMLVSMMRTKPKGKTSVDIRDAMAGLEDQRPGEPPAMAMLKPEPRERKRPARNDLIIRSG